MDVMLNRLKLPENIPWTQSEMVWRSQTSSCVSVTSTYVFSLSGLVHCGWKTTGESCSPSVYNHLTRYCPVVHKWYLNSVNGHKALDKCGHFITSFMLFNFLWIDSFWLSFPDKLRQGNSSFDFFCLFLILMFLYHFAIWLSVWTS